MGRGREVTQPRVQGLAGEARSLPELDGAAWQVTRSWPCGLVWMGWGWGGVHLARGCVRSKQTGCYPATSGESGPALAHFL